jgi:chromosome segregation ATPase
MVKMLFNLFNKRKREIERLNNVIDELLYKNLQFESNIRQVVAKNSLLEREKDNLINRIKDCDTQVKKLNLVVDDLNRIDNNSKYY